MNPRLVKPCDRPLKAAESELLAGLLARSDSAPELQSQLPLLQVAAESTSSWPILEFSVAGKRGAVKSGMRIVADFQYGAADGLLGLFVYEREGLLAGMECWAIDGLADPDTWPSIEMLSPL